MEFDWKTLCISLYRYDVERCWLSRGGGYSYILTQADTCSRRGYFDVFICCFGCAGIGSYAQWLHEAAELGGTGPEFGCQHRCGGGGEGGGGGDYM